MKDRLSTLLTAIGAVLLATFLLIPPSEDHSKELSVPTSEDRGGDGLAGLYQWLQANNVPVFSLRNRYSQLAKKTELAASGNLMIISMPQRREALASEWRALSEWVNDGNSLLILGAAYTMPEWSEGASCFCEIKKLLSRHDWNLWKNNRAVSADNDEAGEDDEAITLAGTIDRVQKGLESFTPGQTKIETVPDIALLDGVSSIHGELMPALIARNWSISPDKQHIALRLLGLTENPEVTVFWQIESEHKPIYLSLIVDMFANDNLDKADNAQLIANLIAVNLEPGGQVIFDDYHFGLSELYDPERFFSDSRLHNTIAFVGLLWLLYVGGYTNRLAPVRVRKRPMSGTDFVEAMAGFFSHRLDKATLAEELVEHLIQDLRRQRQFPDDQQAWLWLQQHTQVSSQQFSQIQQAYRRQKIPLDKLTHTLTHIRTALLL